MTQCVNNTSPPAGTLLLIRLHRKIAIGLQFVYLLLDGTSVLFRLSLPTIVEIKHTRQVKTIWNKRVIKNDLRLKIYWTKQAIMNWIVSNGHYLSDLSLLKANALGLWCEQIAILAIRNHELWIRNLVCYILNHSAPTMCTAFIGLDCW